MSTIPEGLLRPAWVEIDLAALRHNVREIRKHTNDTRIIAIVKANGYGHGAVPVSRTLEEEGITDFAVATLEEAIELRDAGISGRILLLGLLSADYAAQVLDHDLTIVLDSVEEAARFSDYAEAKGGKIHFFLTMDTGMGRIGVQAGEESAVQDVRAMAAMPGLTLDGLISHFATANEEDKSYVEEQLGRYNKFLEMTGGDPEFPVKTLANSAATLLVEDAWFDGIRPGFILYGHSPLDDGTLGGLDLKPMMQVKSQVVKVKDLPAGSYVGYGRMFRAERQSRIATVPLGYIDGYPRAYAPEGFVLINGQKAPIAGAICMDQFMVDVTDLPDVKVGDDVVIMSTDPDGPTAEVIANACGVVSYEIVCGFDRRLPKVYLDEKQAPCA